MTKRVALYARVSTSDHGQDLETQFHRLRELADQRGWDVTEFSDQASAGDYRGRKEWRRLLGLVEKGRFDAVCVYNLDRASRSTLDALTFIENLHAWGVDFVSATEAGMDTTTPLGKALFTISAAFAELERARNRERVKSGLANARAKGKRIGRPPLTADADLMRRFAKLRPQIESGELPKSRAAKKLRIGHASLLRLMEPPAENRPPKPGSVSGADFTHETTP